jgi:hypothetical protein
MVDFLHKAPHAFHGSVALLRGTGGRDAGRKDDQGNQGKYVLGTDGQVVASLKDDLPYVGQARPAAHKSAPSCRTKQLAVPIRSGVQNTEDMTATYVCVQLQPHQIKAREARPQ